MNFSIDKDEHDSWLSISDMMTGLMMIFLFVAIIYIQEVRAKFDDFSNIQNNICSDLRNEFEREITPWRMEICEGGLLIRFDSQGLFQPGSKELSDDFKILLANFYPRFNDILWEHLEDIDELRIEGHSSSEFGDLNELNAYLANTVLSQDRSYEVMNYVLNLAEISTVPEFLEWSFQNLTAHGMSSSNIIVLDGIENRVASRRVEFRIRTRFENELIDIIRSIDEAI